MTSLLTLALAITSIVATSTEEQTRKISEPGLIFFQGNNVLVKSGHHYVKLSTNLKPDEDIPKIHEYVTYFSKICRSANANLNVTTCIDFEKEITYNINNTLNAINTLERTIRRVRRNSDKGALAKLWDFLFGSNEPDDSTSAGIVVHATEAIKHVEQQMRAKEKHIETNLDIVSEAFKMTPS